MGSLRRFSPARATTLLPTPPFRETETDWSHSSPLREEGGRPDDVTEIFLNNALLENGLAHRYDNVKPADWEE
jgi:hypothetical protein